MMKIDPTLQAVLAELTARQDLESASTVLVERLSQTSDPYCREIDALANPWLEILRLKTPVVHASVWADDKPSQTPRSVATWGLRDHSFAKRVAKAFSGRRSASWPVSQTDILGHTRFNAFLSFAEGPRHGIGILAVSQAGNGAESIVQFASSYIATRLIDQMAPGSHLRGYKDMAARVTEVAGICVMLARLELETVRSAIEEHCQGAQDSLSGVQAALRHLDQAHDAFRRAQLFGIDWRRVDPPTPVDLYEVLEEVDRDLGATVIQGSGGPNAPRTLRWKVHASRQRLYYALRDLTVMLWVLGGMRAQVLRNLNPRRHQVRLTGTPTKGLRHYRGQDVTHLLTAPDQFIRGNDPHDVVRTLGIQTAIHLIQECGGTVASPVDRGGRLSFILNLRHPTLEARKL